MMAQGVGRDMSTYWGTTDNHDLTRTSLPTLCHSFHNRASGKSSRILSLCVYSLYSCAFLTPLLVFYFTFSYYIFITYSTSSYCVGFYGESVLRAIHKYPLIGSGKRNRLIKFKGFAVKEYMGNRLYLMPECLFHK